MQLLFFDDELSNRFKPLTLSRPLSNLRVGIQTIEEKWMFSLGIEHHIRLLPEYLSGLFLSDDFVPDLQTVCINSRVLPNQELISAIQSLNVNEVLNYDGVCIAAKLSLPQMPKYGFKPDDSKSIALTNAPHSLDYLWDMLSSNAGEIEADIQRLKLQPSEADFSHVILSNPSQIYIHPTATVEAGTILLADKGPIYIGMNATVEAGSILKGPVAVCDSATIKMSARIYDGTTVGTHCKVGGEVSNSIFHSYSNKGHDGYVGNSIIGQWCNLGADTNTSNLKNNYGKVHLPNWDTKQASEDGVQFMGTVMGDHSKTSINTMLNTGTICGVSSNIFCAGFPDKYIPSFTWYDGQQNPEYRFDKAIEAMEAMMKRRGEQVTDAYATMMKYIFEHSKS